GFDGFAFQQALRRVGERRVAYDVRGARCAVPDRAARQPAQDPGGSVVGIGVDGVHPVTVSAIAVVGDDIDDAGVAVLVVLVSGDHAPIDAAAFRVVAAFIRFRREYLPGVFQP